jgi:hypothetical protein
MLILEMVLNVVISKWGIPSLDSGCRLAFEPYLLLTTKYNAEATLKAGHLPSGSITTKCNLNTIAGIIALHISRTMWRRHDKCAAKAIMIVQEHHKTRSNGLSIHTFSMHRSVHPYVQVGAFANLNIGNIGRNPESAYNKQPCSSLISMC